MNPREVAGLASTRTYPLRSSFRPSYNMAVNLVHQFGRETGPASCSSSPSRSSRPTRPWSGWPGSCARPRTRSTGYAEAAHLPPRRLHGVRRAAPPDLATLEKGASTGPPGRPARGGHRVAAPAQAGRRDRGAGRQVRRLRRRRRPGLRRRTSPRPYVVTADRQARRLAMIDFPTPVEPVTRVKVPRNFNGRNPQMRRDLASRAAHPDPRPDAAAAARDARPAARAGDRPGSADDRRSPACAPSSRRTRATTAPTARTTPAGRERWFKLDRDAADAAAPGRAAHQHRGPPVRPGLRGADRARTTSTGDDRSPTAGRHLMRIYSDWTWSRPSRCATGLWDDLSAVRAGGRAVGAGLRGPAARRRLVAAAARAAGSRR